MLTFALYSNNGRLTKNNSPPLHIDYNVRSSEIYTDIAVLSHSTPINSFVMKS